MALSLMYTYCEFCVKNSSAISTMSVCGSIHQKDTIREGGDTALWTANTVDTVETVYTVDTVDIAYTVDIVYTEG